MTTKELAIACVGDTIIFQSGRWKNRTAEITHINPPNEHGYVRIEFFSLGQHGSTTHKKVKLVKHDAAQQPHAQ